MKKNSVIVGEQNGQQGYPDSTNSPTPVSKAERDLFVPKKQEPIPEEHSIRTSKGRDARISVPTFDGLQMLNVEDIVKCIAHESYTEIILICGAKFMVSRNLKEYQDMLTAFNFFRIHNSTLINLRHVRKYVRGEGGYVMMADGKSCEVSRRKKQELLNRLSIVEF